MKEQMDEQSGGTQEAQDKGETHSKPSTKLPDLLHVTLVGELHGANPLVFEPLPGPGPKQGSSVNGA